MQFRMSQNIEDSRWWPKRQEGTSNCALATWHCRQKTAVAELLEAPRTCRRPAEGSDKLSFQHVVQAWQTPVPDGDDGDLQEFPDPRAAYTARRTDHRDPTTRVQPSPMSTCRGSS